MFDTAKTLIFVLVMALGGLGFPLSSQAETADECGEWTLLPDVRCVERMARPEGTFNPVGMPFLFEDPHITTGLNFAYVYHQLPEGPVFDGGGAHVLALQIRLALTDRLGFIATKDGFTMLRPGGKSAVPESNNFFDMTGGFKYALFESDEHDFILSPAIRYEISLGAERLFQGYGDGVFIPSASFRWGLGKLGLEGANLIGSLGGQVPIDGDRNSQSLFYNIHVDYGFEIQNSVVKYVVPFLELNGIHYTKNGTGQNPVQLRGGGTVPLRVAQTALMTGSFEGFDAANLGSRGIKGENVLVMGGGIRLPTTWGISFAAMYEGPLTSRKDIHDGRFTFMATWEM